MARSTRRGVNGSGDDLADRVRAALGVAGAPTTLGQLAARLEAPVEALAKVIEGRALKGEVLSFPLKKGSGRRADLRDEPVYARSALDAPAALGHVLGFVLGQVRTKRTAFTAVELAAQLMGGRAGGRGAWLVTALRSALDAARLPPGFGAVRLSRAWVVFRLEDLVSSGKVTRPEPAPPVAPEPPARLVTNGAAPLRPDASPETFAEAFERAFTDIDHAGRRLNFVKLHDLRRALPAYDRATFDAGLRALRLAGRYELDPAEGTHDRLTDDERAAGIAEAGMRLVYCRRKT